jgi:23S rRNA (cytosine1962-C5)-methyltransferase
VRWIVDDALAFVRREARRGRRYDGIVLDPPSYGHGPDGRRWTLDDQLPDLLDGCLAVAAEEAFVLLTGHAEGWLPDDYAAALAEAFVRADRRRDATGIEAEALELRARSGAAVLAGAAARWAPA